MLEEVVRKQIELCFAGITDENVDVRISSAGAGALFSLDDMIPPYEATFLPR